MSGGRGLPKPRHTHAITPVSRKHQFSSAKLHVSMFLDDIASCHDIPMTLTGVFTMLLDIRIATLVGEIQFGVSVSLELHAVARPPVWDSFVLVFGRLLPYLPIRFNSDLYTCTHTRQGIHDTKMSDIDTFTIMLDVLWYCCHCSLAIRYALLHIINKRYDFTDKGTCNFTALPYLEDDCETTCHMLVSQYFYFKIHSIGEWDKESTTSWCDRSIPATNGGLNDSRRGSAESGIILSPLWSHSLYHRYNLEMYTIWPSRTYLGTLSVIIQLSFITRAVSDCLIRPLPASVNALLVNCA